MLASAHGCFVPCFFPDRGTMQLAMIDGFSNPAAAFAHCGGKATSP